MLFLDKLATYVDNKFHIYLLPHSLSLLVSCLLFMFVFIEFVLILLFCTAIKNDTFFFLELPT